MKTGLGQSAPPHLCDPHLCELSENQKCKLSIYEHIKLDVFVSSPKKIRLCDYRKENKLDFAQKERTEKFKSCHFTARNHPVIPHCSQKKSHSPQVGQGTQRHLVCSPLASEGLIPDFEHVRCACDRTLAFAVPSALSAQTWHGLLPLLLVLFHSFLL